MPTPKERTLLSPPEPRVPPDRLAPGVAGMDPSRTVPGSAAQPARHRAQFVRSSIIGPGARGVPVPASAISRSALPGGDSELRQMRRSAPVGQSPKASLVRVLCVPFKQALRGGRPTGRRRVVGRRRLRWHAPGAVVLVPGSLAVHRGTRRGPMCWLSQLQGAASTCRARTDPAPRSSPSIRAVRSSRRCSRVSGVDRRSPVP